MSSENPSIRRAVEAIAIKIDDMLNVDDLRNTTSQNIDTFTFSGQEIGNSLWGLRNMTADHPEIRHILRSLAVRIRQSPALMNGQNIGNALYGIHAMDDEYEEVREVLCALAYKIVASDSPLSSLDVGMALYGVSSKDHSSAEVRVILGSLIHAMKQADELNFELQDLSMAIIGILKSSPWIREDFIRVLASRTPGMLTVDDIRQE
jgi:hypothetical protein